MCLPKNHLLDRSEVALRAPKPIPWTPKKAAAAITDVTKIAFLGLGVMGYPMAGHLAAAGYPLQVYNRTQSKAAAFARQFDIHQDWSFFTGEFGDLVRIQECRPLSRTKRFEVVWEPPGASGAPVS